MESVNIVEVNPILFMREFISAVENGYYIENTNAGHISENVLKEITLYKNEDKEFDPIPLGEMTVVEYNTQLFLNQVCHAVAVGAKFDLDTLVWDTLGTKIVKGVMYLKGEFTKEDLAEQDWDTFKSSVKTIGITGRDRNLMTTKYLQMTGQEV